jgi:hypothetical protein
MILSNAAWPVVFGGRLLVLLLEQRRVAGRERLSGRRSVEQPGYSGASRRHLRRHRAPITATRPMDIRATATPATVIQAMDIPPTHHRGMDTQDIPVLPVTPIPRAMDTMVMRGTPLRLLHRITDTKAKGDILLRLDPRPTNTTATRDTPLIPLLRARDTPLILHRAMDTKATGAILPTTVPQPLNTMGMRDTPPIRQTTNTMATEHTRPILVPPAMATRGTSDKPRCRCLQVMNTRTRRRLPLTPFPIIDYRRSSSAAPDH